MHGSDISPPPDLGDDRKAESSAQQALREEPTKGSGDDDDKRSNNRPQESGARSCPVGKESNTTPANNGVEMKNVILPCAPASDAGSSAAGLRERKLSTRHRVGDRFRQLEEECSRGRSISPLSCSSLIFNENGGSTEYEGTKMDRTDDVTNGIDNNTPNSIANCINVSNCNHANALATGEGITDLSTLRDLPGPCHGTQLPNGLHPFPNSAPCEEWESPLMLMMHLGNADERSWW
uniref:Uncharacterized protein TCIL3000_11_3710 n=1 Tax=Trypanosoma congolense (strain IL3000) TaxID=1068625 RepID=G0V002_TRYCI|nr:unnamed protein product [Trypanosoma congolense IL3000]